MAGRQPVDRRHRRAREGGRQRRHLPTANRGDPLRRVDHPAAAEGDQPVRADVLEDRGGGLGNLRGADEMGRLGGFIELRGLRERPLRGQEVELVPAGVGEQLRRVGEQPLAENHGAPPSVVPPADLLHKPAPGLEPGTSSLQVTCSTN